jgi:hypothetical protein
MSYAFCNVISRFSFPTSYLPALCSNVGRKHKCTQLMAMYPTLGTSSKGL